MTDTEEISCGDVLLLSQENVHQIVNLVDESACKIKHLVISNAKICQLPQDVCSCHWIQTLELKQNQITTLGDLSPLTMLTRLIVDEPLLPKDELLFWSKYIFPIRKLDLSWMRLTSVPDIIFKIVPTMRFPLLNIDLSDNSVRVVITYKSNLFEPTTTRFVKIPFQSRNEKSNMFNEDLSSVFQSAILHL
eukprot:TRINITY_DN1595_c0_g2_i2.p1 TRINITY_DN1595_c0_g2~~TRINITY_DN1595_c0_g2_i2.p1  ORF type:complete len:191 (-),score=16.43 TRINITY_DN1595_c0_g2_i2:719-1291(-)